MTRLRLFHRVGGEEAHGIRHDEVRRRGPEHVLGDMLNRHSERLLRSMSCRMSGVRISCIARSSFDPGITIEFARDMKLCGIIDNRYGKSMPRGFFSRITTI